MINLNNRDNRRKRTITPLLLSLSLLLLLLTPKHSQSFSTPSPSNHNPNSNSKNSSSNNSSKNQPKPKYQTTSQKITSEYNANRLSRLHENIPGKTSAIPGSQNLPINPIQTQTEWYNQASTYDKLKKEYIGKALDYVKGLQLEKAKECYDYVLYELNNENNNNYDHNQQQQQQQQQQHNCYCWQYGIVLFYLGYYHHAAEIFVYNCKLYESKFGIVASEERLWRDACELKIRSVDPSSLLDNDLKKMKIAQLDSSNVVDGGSSGNDGSASDLLLMQETRKVLRIARDLFSSSIQGDLGNEVLSRGKLRSICGEYDNNNSSNNANNNSNNKKGIMKTDKKMWRLSSWYYLGLHYDVIGDYKSSKDCMKMALRQCVSSFGNGDDSEFYID